MPSVFHRLGVDALPHLRYRPLRVYAQECIFNDNPDDTGSMESEESEDNSSIK
jgi:hypothetical protein